MKKKLLSMMAFAMLVSGSVVAQDRVAYRTVTDAQKGVIVEKGIAQETKAAGEVKSDVTILWQKSEVYAVGQHVIYGEEAQKVIINWQLNDMRIAQYNDAGVVEWESPITYQYAEAYANKAGTLIGAIDGSSAGTNEIARFIDAASGEVVLTLDYGTGSCSGIAVFPDGTGAYVGAAKEDGKYYCEAYQVGSTTPIWSTEIPGNIVILGVSDDNSKLVVCTGTSVSKAFILNPINGEIIQDLYYESNSPTQAPGMSYDGEYLAITGFDAKGTLYKWNGSQYEEVWTKGITGPGASSTWGQGCAVSADGSTIAFGTLDFVSTGSGYNGSVYVFNNYSAEPIWSKHDMGDQVAQLDMTADGSMIVAASYGALDHTTPDFYVFRKQSAEPLSTMSTSGAFEYVDISDDGTKCITAGKAVHPREMGWGGQAYYLNPIPENSGTLAGVVDAEGTDDDSNVTISIKSLTDYYVSSKEDGSYALKYIPAGTYDVTISKVGYYPVVMAGVVITAGETATLDATLEETGSPVQNLFASQGAARSVELRWDEYQGECASLKVYRKSSESAPFGAPIATLEKDAVTFVDEDVIPTNKYYYAITAEVSEGVESPFSNIVCGYPTTLGVVSEINVPIATAPVIDGIMDDGEWDDAFRFDASDLLGREGSAQHYGVITMYMKTDCDHLYCLTINHNDNELTSGDRIAFYFDDNGNYKFEPSGDDSEGNYWMDFNADGTGMIRYRSIYETGGVGETVTMENVMIAANDGTGEVVMEFAIPLGGSENSSIVPNAENFSTMCMYIGNSSAPDREGYWPIDNNDYFTATGYGKVNFFVEDTNPPAPQNLKVDAEAIVQYGLAPISWDLPEINDLDHFVVYINVADGGKGETTVEVYGNQCIIDVEEYSNYSIYVKAVDLAGNESEASETLTFVTEGVEEITADVKVYPNPSNSYINVVADVEGQTEMTVFDITGRVVMKSNFSGNINERITVANWNKGVYFIVLSNGNQLIMTQKVIIE